MRERHVGCRGEMVEFITSNPRVVESMVSCDEIRIHFYDPETKK